MLSRERGFVLEVERAKTIDCHIKKHTKTDGLSGMGGAEVCEACNASKRDSILHGPSFLSLMRQPAVSDRPIHNPLFTVARLDAEASEKTHERVRIESIST